VLFRFRWCKVLLFALLLVVVTGCSLRNVRGNDQEFESNEEIIIDDAEAFDLIEYWQPAEKCTGISYSDEIAYEGIHSIKISYNLSANEWATAHHNRFEIATDVLDMPGGTLRFKVFNPNKDIANKFYLRVTLKDSKGRWWWPPGWGGSVYDDPGFTIGFSGSIDGSEGGDGWYTYETKLEFYAPVEVIQIKVNYIGDGCVVGHMFVDSIEVIPAEDKHAFWERPKVDLLSGFRNMYQPEVIEIKGEEYPYRMWFMGWAVADSNPGYPGSDAIFHARSKDLDSWEVYSGDHWDSTCTPNLWIPVITAQDKYYDQWHNGDPSVVYYDGRYYMAYSSTGFDLDGFPLGHPNDTDGEISCIMGAISDDGINWTRSEAPILIYEPEIGILNDYDNPAYLGNFHRPSLMYDEDRWRMWFDYWESGPYGMSMAHAENFGDPLNPDDWQITHDLSLPIIREWPNPDVIKVGSQYYSFSDPSGYPGGVCGWTRRQLREAVSSDGITWRVLDYIEPDYDAPTNHVPQALITEIDGAKWLYLFYANQIGGEPYNWRHSRIRYMRRPVSVE
jgi:hypothetical protein